MILNILRELRMLNSIEFLFIGLKKMKVGKNIILQFIGQIKMKDIRIIGLLFHIGHRMIRGMKIIVLQFIGQIKIRDMKNIVI